MPSSKPRAWVASTSVLGLLSVAGAFGINLWLNPDLAATSVSESNTAPQTVESDAIEYRFGTVLISVTATAGKITAINTDNSTCSHGWEAAWPMLTEAAIAANGSDFENISGATFTAEAFKEALNTAISKLS